MKPGAPPVLPSIPLNRYVVFGLLALGGCALDLASKSWIFNRLGMPGSQPPWWLIPGAFCLETSLNEGALFGVGQGRAWLFAALSVVAIVTILGWLFVGKAARSLTLTIALGSISAGILGNLYDRWGLPGLRWNAAYTGHLPGDPVFAVRDWLHVQVDAIGFDFAVFNLADSMLVCGVALFVWHTFRAPGGADAATTGQPAEPPQAVTG